MRDSSAISRLKEAQKETHELLSRLDLPHPDDIEETVDFILEELPSFVYYSTYGNLDSEIYLPHVIDNLQRSDLTGRTAAQTRTLRVLFNYVGLDPREILRRARSQRDNSTSTENRFSHPPQKRSKIPQT